MSIKLQTQVWDLAPFKGTHLLVLLSLADQCGDNGRGCWSSVAYIAASARCDTRTAQRAFVALEKAGWLRREMRPDTTSMYYVTVPADAEQQRRLREGGDILPGVTEDPEAGSQAEDEPDIPSQEGATPASPGGDTRVTSGVTPVSPRTVSEPSENHEEPFVSPEAAADEGISDEEVAAPAPQAAASPSRHDERELLSEAYGHREWMPDGEAVKEVKERFIEHDLSRETLRRETNAYIKWMSDRGKAPHSRGWRDWMVRYYRRIIDQNLKALGIDVQSYKPDELTQEEREAQRNEMDSYAQTLEASTDDAGR